MPRNIRVLIACLLSAVLWHGPAQAAVADLSPQGFVVQHSVHVNVPVDAAYAALVDVGQWWNAAHTYSGDAHRLHIDARALGCFCESLADGGTVAHMRVVFAQAPSLLRLDGALGPLQASGLAGSMTWQLKADGEGTQIQLQYSVGGYWKGGFAGIAPAVDAMLREQMTRLQALLNQGRPAAVAH